MTGDQAAEGVDVAARTPEGVPAATPGRTSVEKLREIITELRGAAPDGESGARIRQALGMMPTLLRMLPIPDDPKQLDGMLLIGARVALRLRSDDAEPPPSLEELTADDAAWLQPAEPEVEQ